MLRLQGWLILYYLLLFVPHVAVHAQENTPAQPVADSQTTSEPEAPKESGASGAPLATPEEGNFFAIEDRMVDLFEAHEAAVVRVHASVKETNTKIRDSMPHIMIGTGFFVSPQGHVVTTALVAKDASRVWIDHKGKPYLAECWASDSTSGIAILKIIDPPQDLPFIPLFIPSSPAKSGRFCVAINRENGLSAAPSLGIIKNNAEVSYVLPTEHIRTDLPCPIASAGGPVFKLRTHELIGVQMGVISQSASSLVIPVKAVKKIYDDVLNTRKVQYAWLGVSVRMEHDWERGISYIVIDAVDPASPAQDHDIKEGDRLIRIDKRPITSVGDLNAALFFASVGQYIEVTTQRGDKRMNFEVRVRPRPDNLPRVTTTYWGNRSPEPTKEDPPKADPSKDEPQGASKEPTALPKPPPPALPSPYDPVEANPFHIPALSYPTGN